MERKSENFELIKAAENCDLDKVKELINSGADLNIQNEHRNTALMSILFYHKAEEKRFTQEAIAKLLIHAKTNLNIQNNYGETALLIALKRGYFDDMLITLLVDSGSDINILDNDHNSNLMHAGTEKIVKLLLERKADINAQNIDGWTPLIYATFFANHKITKLLVELGANINLQKNDDETALSIWTSWTNLLSINDKPNDIIKFLIYKGANLYLINKEGKTAFDVSYNQEIKDIIIKAKEDLIEQLKEAIKNNNKKRVKMFLIKYYILDENGDNALHIAARMRNIEMFKLISKIKPNFINKENLKNETPIDLNHEMLIYLILESKNK